MNIFKKIHLYLKYKKRKFKRVGDNADYKQLTSRYLFSENIAIGENTKILSGAFFDGVGGGNYWKMLYGSSELYDINVES